MCDKNCCHNHITALLDPPSGADTDETAGRMNEAGGRMNAAGEPVSKAGEQTNATGGRAFQPAPPTAHPPLDQPTTSNADTPTHPITHPHPQPSNTTLPRETINAIISDYHRGDINLIDIANRHELTVTQLLDFLDDPEINALLDRITHHARLQAERAAALAEPAAVEALRFAASCCSADHRLYPPRVEARLRETHRKAAAQVQRINAHYRARSASEGPPPRRTKQSTKRAPHPDVSLPVITEPQPPQRKTPQPWAGASKEAVDAGRAELLPVPDRGLGRRQPGDRHAERRARDIVHADVVAEVDAGGVAAVLAADADLEVGLGGASLLCSHLDELTDAGDIEGLEGVVGEEVLLEVVGQEGVDVVA